MYLFKVVKELRKQLHSLQTTNRSFGFVPTMGALHEGHLSLVRRSKAENSFTICSVFVNPTQFNETSDLEKYPRYPSKDIEMLASVGCDILFLPRLEEVYPKGKYHNPSFSFGRLDSRLEGAHRPGHFAGVAQVVHRLLQILEPTRLYLGQKDYQQWLIVKELIRQASLPVEAVMCPIIREKSGLAMSSRNQRLSPKQRKEAAILYKTLQGAKEKIKKMPPAAIQKWALKQLEIPGFRPEYFEIVDAQNLQPVTSIDPNQNIIACAALWADDVRLIDNLLLLQST